MSKDEEYPTITASCPKCKRMVACAVQNTERSKEVAKQVAQWVREGMAIATMETQQVRSAKWGHEEGCTFR